MTRALRGNPDDWESPEAAEDKRLVTEVLNGNRGALDVLVQRSLPVVYSYVRRSLGYQSSDVDDIVQDTMVQALRNLRKLRDPLAFRTWLLTIATRESWRRGRSTIAAGVADLNEMTNPMDEVENKVVLRARLSDERRELAKAEHWIDPDHRQTLSLWWLEVGGEVDRSQLAEVLDVTTAHAGVRVQRMKDQLDVARSIVRLLHRRDQGHHCPGLESCLIGWDTTPTSIMRKRLGRHISDCRQCRRTIGRLVPPDLLLTGFAVLPVPADLQSRMAVEAGNIIAANSQAAAAVHTGNAAVHTGHPAIGTWGLTTPAIAKTLAAGIAAIAFVTLGAGLIQRTESPKKSLGQSVASSGRGGASAAPNGEPASPRAVPAAPADTSTSSGTTSSPGALPGRATTDDVMPPTHGGRYLYVSPAGNNANPGTRNAPFKTLQKGADSVKPGDTLLVMKGTYFQQNPDMDVVTACKGGTPTKPVTIAPYPGHKVVLRSQNWNAIRVCGSWMIVQGFTIIGNSSQIPLKQAMAQRYNTNNPRMSGNGITVTYPYGSPGTIVTHVTVRKNKVSHMPGNCIGSMRADYVTIEDNEVFDCTRYSPFGTSAIGAYQPQNTDDRRGYKMIFRRNKVHHSRQYVPWTRANGKITEGHGIQLDDFRNTQDYVKGPRRGAYKGRTLVENNVVYGNGGHAINVYLSDHVDIVNNTTYNNCGSSDTADGEISSSTGTDVRIANNVAVAARNRMAIPLKKHLTGKNLFTVNAKVFQNARAGDLRPAQNSPAMNAARGNLVARDDITHRRRTKPAELGAYEIR